MHSRVLVLAAVAGSIAIFADSSLAQGSSRDSFLLPEQRQALLATGVTRSHLMSQGFAENERARAAIAVSRSQSAKDVNQELVRVVAQAAELQNRPLTPSNITGMQINAGAGMAQAAHESISKSLASGNDTIARMDEARWSAQAQMYQTTADMQMKVGEMIAGACTAGAGGLPIASSAGAMGSLANPSITAASSRAATKPLNKREPAMQAPSRQVEQTGHWVSGGGEFHGAGATGTWIPQPEMPSKDGECLTGVATAGLSCAKPVLEILECIRSTGGLGPYGLNALACAGGGDPSDYADCLRELLDTGRVCVEAATDALAPNTPRAK